MSKNTIVHLVIHRPARREIKRSKTRGKNEILGKAALPGPRSSEDEGYSVT
jgi:hypothetical protein